jgi:hypothetical protein
MPKFRPLLDKRNRDCGGTNPGQHRAAIWNARGRPCHGNEFVSTIRLATYFLRSVCAKRLAALHGLATIHPCAKGK